MRPIKVIERLLPHHLIDSLGSVLKRGSTKDGNGVLTHNKSYFYYTYKLLKHLIRAILSPKSDKESGESHFTHSIIRLMQLSLKHKEEK